MENIDLSLYQSYLNEPRSFDSGGGYVSVVLLLTRNSCPSDRRDGRGRSRRVEIALPALLVYRATRRYEARLHPGESTEGQRDREREGGGRTERSEAGQRTDHEASSSVHLFGPLTTANNLVFFVPLLKLYGNYKLIYRTDEADERG